MRLGAVDDFRTELHPHPVWVTIFDHETLLLDLPWLIHVKRATGRPKDLEVIAELEALLEERGDR